ncbi:hypothetical protein MMC28_006223 [Mycoblastus sanguinarius]|nr:hypothetical protein [Mycoblastus sanguinarius]
MQLHRDETIEGAAISSPIPTSLPDLCSLSMASPSPTTNADPDEKCAEDSMPTEIPPHRSHSPTKNLKRSDPFKFGSRYLQPDDNIYEFNAWDHVVPDASYYAYAEAQYSSQRASPVSDFDKARFNNDPAKWWNKFYSNNTSHFFKDRKWLQQEFPVLTKLIAKEAGPAVILEVGAGAGNTAFPILAANENPRLMIHACDFSGKAVDLVRENEAYDAENLRASVWDISSDDLPPEVGEGSVDVVLLVFIFSALSPRQWDAAVRNVYRILRPGGKVCFRDYGKGDLTQVRFKKGRLLEEKFYIRGDGTRVYFFEEDELRKIWGGGARRINGSRTNQNGAQYTDEDKEAREEPTRNATKGHTDAVTVEDPSLEPQAEFGSSLVKNRFEIVSLGVDRRMLVNRQKQLKMYRCWMQGCFKKPDNSRQR